ncbi:small GTP-binding protein, putative [Trichomonas vaginalis G3]|uniref:Small GTP-binding protein, putative n=1 Tax=Trichomonas vaginalis (strain ATCC PRA-98 / G3) TaxID=412133 RepID=A2EII0_TRIV3|nr:GTPase protein [Trichomonas vaginalis G3]EAY07501.1 small GTP-binding protein, putative [Trichomonas vaginalis G3]KAI5550546.1 GTPase protein [Trichomonas vaginalis G3]|eukprot:XP_001319724.1 small GTP-binding protein [Trichomonas vaginalis G3]
MNQGTQLVDSFKLVLIGDCNIGKTCMVEKLTKGQINENYKPTIGAGHTCWTCTINEDQVDFQIWDTAGEERFASLAPMYYKDSDGAIVVFSQIDAQSAKNVPVWIERFHSTVSESTPILICCNKIDLEPTYENTMEQYAKSRNFMYARASAFSGEGVEEAFLQIAEKIKQSACSDRFLNKSLTDEKKDKKSCC